MAVDDPGTGSGSTDSPSIHPGLEDTIEDQLHAVREGLKDVPGMVGRWKPIAFLGAGATSCVVLATALDTGERAAVKIAKPSEHARRALHEEAAILQQVRHPCLPRIVETGEAGGLDYIALDLIDGHDLDTVVQRSVARQEQLDGRRVIAWFRELAQALQELHDRELVHRDVKPANIMIRGDGRPILIDLGLASVSGNEQDEFVGTLLFMAPEQLLRGPVAASPSSDVYSLADSLHFALSGYPWALASSPRELIRHVAFGSPPLGDWAAADVPHAIDSVLRRALRKNPEDRYASAAEFAGDLDRVLAQRATSVMSTTDRATAHVRRFRGTFGTAVAVLLLGIAWFSWSHYQAGATCRAVLREARAALESGQPVRAADLLRPHREMFGEDARYRELRGQAIVASAPIRLDRLMQEVAILVPGTGSGYSYEAEIEAAAIDLEAVPFASDLALQLALRAFLRNDLDEADSMLRRHATALTEDPHAADLARLIQLTDGSLHLDRALIDELLHTTPANTTGKALRGILALHVRNALPRYSAHIADADRLLDRVVELAESIRASHPAHRTAFAIEGIARLQYEDPRSALAPLEALATLAPDPDELGVAYYLTIARLANVSELVEPPWLETTRQLMMRFGADNPALVDRVSTWIAAAMQRNWTEQPGPRLGSASGTAWLATLGDDVGSLTGDPRVPARLVECTSLSLLLERAGSHRLSAYVDSFDASRLDPAFGSSLGRAHANAFWAGLSELSEDFASITSKLGGERMERCRRHLDSVGDRSGDFAASRVALDTMEFVAARRAAGRSPRDANWHARLQQAIVDLPALAPLVSEALEAVRPKHD